MLLLVQKRCIAQNQKKMEVCGWVQQKIDFGVRQLSYPFFSSGFNSTKVIQLTCLHDSCKNLSTALIWL